MFKKIILLVIILFFIQPVTAKAIYDPLSVANNRFGIHVTSENDFEDAAKLVNTNGDWGYVTFVITEEERNTERWQRAFDKARKLHLIPIVRIASSPAGNMWKIPSTGEIDNWVKFLNSINWVIENRYIVVGNEPNHTLEWGGKIDPAGYSDYLMAFSKALKVSNDNFFILPAGLDAASNNSKTTITERRFIDGMIKKNPDVFNYIDGWTSHSYPTTGIDTYKSELSYLKSLGVNTNFPVFITETGWQLNSKFSNEAQISDSYKNAFSSTWKDENIVAVTPFILNYPNPPFDKFSWKKADGTFYAFYNVVADLDKVEGNPTQESIGTILGSFLPSFSFANARTRGEILVKNTGQSIWDEKDLDLIISGGGFGVISKSIGTIEPGKTAIIYFDAISPSSTGTYRLNMALSFKNKIISNVYSVNLTNLLIK